MTKFLLQGLGWSFIFLFSGCGPTVDHRLRQMPTVVSGLEQAKVAVIRQGWISLGDDREAVYLSQGIPEREEGERETGDFSWFYSGRLVNIEADRLQFTSRNAGIFPGPLEKLDELEVIFREGSVRDWVLSGE